MIKEIVEKYNKKSKRNIINLLNKIKDFEYKLIDKEFLVYTDNKEDTQTYIFFTDKRICRINIKQYFGNKICNFNVNILSKIKEVEAISQELYNKHFGVDK